MKTRHLSSRHLLGLALVTTLLGFAGYPLTGSAAVATAPVPAAVVGSAPLLIGSAPPLKYHRGQAVVLVSGVAAVTPFTTPTKACRSGFAAGNTWTYLRDYLVQRGYRVFTAPASIGGGVVQETDDAFEGPFEDCPRQLPASMTSNAIGPVDLSAARVARFIRHLHDVYGVKSVHVVGHSLGGFIGRAAIREVRQNGFPVRVRSYTTLGSPWEGAMLADPLDPADPVSACDGLAICETFLDSLLEVPGIEMLVANLKLNNAPVWNYYQTGALTGIPVTLIGGSYFTKPDGIDSKWPNDGPIQLRSALATNVPDSVLPLRSCHEFPLTHSIFVSSGVTAPDDTALTWNPDVGAVIANAIDDAVRGTVPPNRTGCPAPTATVTAPVAAIAPLAW